MVDVTVCVKADSGEKGAGVVPHPSLEAEQSQDHVFDLTQVVFEHGELPITELDKRRGAKDTSCPCCGFGTCRTAP